MLGRRLPAALVAVGLGAALTAGCGARPDVTGLGEGAAGPVSAPSQAVRNSAAAQSVDTAAPDTAPADTAPSDTAAGAVPAEGSSDFVPAAPASVSGTTAPAAAPPATTAATLPPTTTTRPPPAGAYAGADPAAVGANELGEVPILMYHQIVPEPKAVYDRRPEDLRAELERLANEGYVPVTAAEYAKGDFSAVPAGAHPVVLTFDDSTTSQLTLGADGSAAPDTAVAILLEVAAAHPGFRPVATFYVNVDPFAESGKTTLPWLVAHGFEIGNHTLKHTNLSNKSSDEVRMALATLQNIVVTAVPGYTITTMALPQGGKPADMAAAVDGTVGGTTYHFDAVMLAGAEPAKSPFRSNYNPTSVQRIRSQGTDGPEPEWGSTTWLDRLAQHPEFRFTSDGDPNWISFPAAAAGDLAPAYAARAHPY